MLAIGTYSTDSALVLNPAGLRLFVFTAIYAVKVEEHKPKNVYNYVYIKWLLVNKYVYFIFSLVNVFVDYNVVLVYEYVYRIGVRVHI